MTFTAINVLTVPQDKGSLLEQRFAARKAMVESAPGFLSFELLRPVSGTADYLVVTRWRSEADFEEWKGSQRFRHAHDEAERAEPTHEQAATGSTIWSFETVQESGRT